MKSDKELIDEAEAVKVAAPKVVLTEQEKLRLRKQAEDAVLRKLKEQLEDEYLALAKKEAEELHKPKRPEEELVSIVIDLPDGTGLLTDGKLHQHGREYLVPRTIYDDLRARIAAAWRVERELNNPFSNSKWYKKPAGVTLSGGGQGYIPASEAHRY